MKDNPFFLCQPDEIKGCCACCGLLNRKDLSRENLEIFLQDGKFRRDNGWRYLQEECFIEQTVPVRDETTHICAFQGFLTKGSPGCLLHPLSFGEEGRGQSLFGSKVCDNFLCPAYKILSERERKLLIENVDDWYCYTFAVVDPHSTQWILECLETAGLSPGSGIYREKLFMALEILSEHLAAYEGVVFCYSMPEYNLDSVYFSLTSKEAPGVGEIRRRIREIAFN